jgi:purine-binding chemotaxis protein CheW
MSNQAVSTPLLRYIRCTLGQETFALDMSNVNSIQRSDTLRKNLDSTIPVAWFPVRRGEVPVYDMAHLLGRRRSPYDRQQRVILMRPLHGGGRSWGLLVDQVSEIFSAGSEALIPLPGMLSAQNSCFAAAITHGEDLIPLIDPSRLGLAGSRAPSELPAGLAQMEEPSTTPAPGVRAAEGARAARARQLILFSLPGAGIDLNFAVSTVQVLEILAPLPVIPVPGAAQWVLGYSKWRGRAVPLVDLFSRFGLFGRYDLERVRLMILRTSSRTQKENVFGILVDPNIRILRLPAKYRECMVDTSVPDVFIKGMVEIEQRITIIPNMQKIFQTD